MSERRAQKSKKGRKKSASLASFAGMVHAKKIGFASASFAGMVHAKKETLR